MKITVCDECNVGLANDDWTHLDNLDFEDSDETMARIEGTLELYGWLNPLGKANESGYFNCDVCWEIQCGGGYHWETEKD